MNHDFGELRSLLQQQPSALLWEMVTGLVSTWPDPEECDALIAPYVFEHIQTWPKALRSIPKSWIEDLARGTISELVFQLGCVLEYDFFLFDALTCEDVAGLLSTHPCGSGVEALWLNSEVPMAIGDVFGALKRGKHLKHLNALSVALPPNEIAYARHCLVPEEPQLEHLMLKRGRLSCTRLMDWLRGLHQLKQLCLVDQDLGASREEMNELLRWQGWSRLTRLHLFACFTDDDVDALLYTLFGCDDSPTFDHLQVLDLGGNQMEDHHVMYLTESSNLTSLEVLALHFNDLTSRGIRALLDGALPSLRMVIVPPDVVDEAARGVFEDAKVALIPSRDARPLVTSPAYWFS